MPPENNKPIHRISGDYEAFINKKTHLGGEYGFTPTFLPDFLFDFQKTLVEWSVRKGRAALLEDCGLGKTPQQLAWAKNVVRHTNKPVLVIAPLGVCHQTIAEGEKFGIECHRSSDGTIPTGAKIVVTNYEKLHLFNPSDVIGMVGDESGILKNFDGVRKQEITDFMRKLPYRLLCTATAAPNDYVELGTHSEALGEMGYMDMLSKFFKNDQNSNHPNRIWAGGQWRFRGHAEKDFWRWVCSWARAVRKPSDLGFPDGKFILPDLITNQHLVTARFARPDRLFDTPAETLEEQREERRRTLPERCEKAAELIGTQDSAIAWCHLNDEGDRLSRLIPGAVQVSGSDSDERKEEVFTAFVRGEVRVLVTKPRIAGFGLNLQHCAHMTFFPSHSFEEWYQCIRRCWRFGQTRPVQVDIVTSEGESEVLSNLQRKTDQAEKMFAELIDHMGEELSIRRPNPFTKEMELPSWLS